MNLQRKVITFITIILVSVGSLIVTVVASAESGEAGSAVTESGGTYTVKRGDTLFDIARRFGTSVEALASYNDIGSDRVIYVGQELLIHEPSVSEESVTESPPPESGNAAYTVQPGDSLSRIARRHGVPLELLLSVNQISQPNLIRSGLVLTIPNLATNPSPPPANRSDDAPENEGLIYIVQPGDSLFKIAQRTNVPIKTLINNNQISNRSLIYPGQQLILSRVAAESAATATMEVPAEEANAVTFIWPVEGRIVKYFREGHRAIDIAVPAGTPVVAAAGGRVEFSGWNADGYGNLVIIDHGDGWRTFYAHNSTLLVVTGQDVAQAEEVALSGNTGNSTMPHVHLEMVRDRIAMNPCLNLPGGC